MTNQTIRQLNQLNQRFYQTIFKDFSQSRALPWKGWEKLLPHIERLARQKSTQPLRILDIGCGNGRFGEYIFTKFPQQNIVYTGIDQSTSLLDEAAQRLANFSHVSLTLVDVVENLLEKHFILEEEVTFDLIVCFGVIHHIPSVDLRTTFFQSCERLLAKNGIFVCAAWQFPQDGTLLQRALAPQNFMIDQQELEKGDYLLPWKSHSDIARYSHYVDQQEMSALLAATQLLTVETFVADGHEETLNLYAVATK